MKVLLVNGSSNKNGCTYTALSEIAKTLEEEGIESEIFWIGNKPLGGCIGCRKCRELGKYVFNDTVNEFREKAAQADGFFFGTPVHYAGAAGNMTSFMDRLFYSEFCGHSNADFYMKPAACVVSARRAGTTAAFDQMNKYFTMQEMPVMSARYWNMVHGNHPEEVLQDAEGMFNMRVLARNMAAILRWKQAAKEAGVPEPKKEQPIFTNFIRK